MRTVTDEIRELIEKGHALLQRVDAGTARLPRGASAKVITGVIQLKGALNLCEDFDRQMAARVSPQGGMDHSVPLGDR